MTGFALIAGSGFEHLEFEVLTRSPTKTPYGEPSSAVLSVVPRERVVIRAGVIDRGRTSNDPELIDLALACAGCIFAPASPP